MSKDNDWKFTNHTTEQHILAAEDAVSIATSPRKQWGQNGNWNTELRTTIHTHSRSSHKTSKVKKKHPPEVTTMLPDGNNDIETQNV